MQPSKNNAAGKAADTAASAPLNNLFEEFPAIMATGVCGHVFTRRIAGIDVSHDKAEVLRRLDAAHARIRALAGIGDWPLLTVEQIHGSDIAVIDESVKAERCFPGCDGLITNRRGLALGIHVADCCAVYLIDPETPAIGLVHSGKKGTERNIAGKAIDQMTRSFGSKPADLVVQLSPCIRPPHYEVDFAAAIVEQCRSAGVKRVHDSGICTACHPDMYYSYRLEKGKTGRMLALLGMV